MRGQAFGGRYGVAVVFVLLAIVPHRSYATTAFEKLTNMDYGGNSYYTIRNLTLYECQGWCREEPECQAASFSFVSSSLMPVQETVCLLQNETGANNPSAAPRPSDSTYYMVKLNLRSENVCSRPWTFERLPNKMLRGLDNALIFTSTKEACLAACLNEERFLCRSAEYNYVTLQCHLSEHDRRSGNQDVSVVDVQGVDYFENLCLSGEQACDGERRFSEPSLSVSNSVINRYVDAKYYVDLELMANNEEACRRACEIESEILCRSFLFRGPPTGSTYNCQLFHLDHVSLPEGADTFVSVSLPQTSIGSQEPGVYQENVCPRVPDHVVCRRVVTRSRRPITHILCYETPISRSSAVFTYNRGSLENAAALSGGNAGLISTTLPTDGADNAEISGGLAPVDDNEISIPETASEQLDGTTGVTLSPDGADSGSNALPDSDVNCDSSGTCYDVSVQCKDTRISVQVATTRPFSGRIYALGRSKTCNIDVIRSTQFRLDLSLSGQDCNTQAIGTVFSNTVVIQHHSVVMTKTDKIYKVRCTYDMSSRNISFGMMPIRDPDMISITSAPEAPPPSIRIVDSTGREVETVQIGDKLNFRIEIPPNTPYAIFARNCIAMAKDGKSTFKIIDDKGCPADPAIFPRFTTAENALESMYEAFRFTESYGIIFQCNVKYCLRECEPAQCENGRRRFESWGRRRRSVVEELDDPRDPESMTLSREIIVLDFGDHKQKPAASQRDQTTQQLPSYLSFDDHSANDTSTRSETRDRVESCPTKSHVLMLSAACAAMLIVYLLTLMVVVIKRWMTRNNKVL